MIEENINDSFKVTDEGVEGFAASFHKMRGRCDKAGLTMLDECNINMLREELSNTPLGDDEEPRLYRVPV